MNPTLEFLVNRLLPGHDHKKSRDWAIWLLENGHESDAILRLAGIADSTWYLEPELVAGVLHDLRVPHLLDNKTICAEFEKEIVASYYAGAIDGARLIALGSHVAEASRHSPEYVLWTCLAEASAPNEYPACYTRYRFDRFPFDVVLKEALADLGFPEPPRT